MNVIVTVVSIRYAEMVLLAARNGSAPMTESGKDEKKITDTLNEIEERSLSDEQIRGLEIAFLVLVTIGLIILTRL